MQIPALQTFVMAGTQESRAMFLGQRWELARVLAQYRVQVGWYSATVSSPKAEMQFCTSKSELESKMKNSLILSSHSSGSSKWPQCFYLQCFSYIHLFVAACHKLITSTTNRFFSFWLDQRNIVPVIHQTPHDHPPQSRKPVGNTDLIGPRRPTSLYDIAKKLFDLFTYIYIYILSAPQMHMLLLLENMKQQLSQLSTNVNILMARTGSAGQEPVGMPEELQFPLDTTQEVDDFENWLKNPDNGKKKQNLVSVSIRFNYIVIVLVYYHTVGITLFLNHT